MVEIQGARSTNCIAAVPLLNSANSGMLSTRLKPLISNDSPSCGPVPEDQHRTKPPTMGSQISSDSR